VEMTTDIVAADPILDLDLTAFADTVEAWLADPARTAHRLVSLPTAELVAQALAGLPAAPASRPPAVGPIPGGVWRVLPARLLTLHPARHCEGVGRLRISVAEHLELTALVLGRWGWAQGRNRSRGGRRCILGAQYAVFRLGYGTEDTAIEAGRRIQDTLTTRGEHRPYPEWNDLPHTTREAALALVREAAGAR